jgi:hypothetical protein
VEGFAYDWHVTVRRIVGDGQLGRDHHTGLCFFDLDGADQIFFPQPCEVPGSRAYLVERY